MGGDAGSLVAEVTPYISAAVGAYGAAVLAKARDETADATLGLGRRILQRVFGVSQEGSPLPEPLADVAADPHDEDALAALRLVVRKAVAQDPVLASDLRSILAAGASQQVYAGRDALTVARDVVIHYLPQVAAESRSPGLIPPGIGAVPWTDPGFTGRDHPATVRPRQLPASVSYFVGRGEQLARLNLLARQPMSDRGCAVIVIEGTAGVGKTALANHFAASVSDYFPDAQLYANMRGFDPLGLPMTAGDVLRGFLDALGVASSSVPSGPADQACLYRSVLAGKRVLLVIDNVRHADQVRSLLPGSPGSLVLVTSRNHLPALAVDGARFVRVDPFTPEEARELLVHRIGTERLDREPQACGELITRCARLPLALVVAAAHVEAHPGFPLDVLASEFRARRLDRLETGDPATTVRAIFARSYEHLSDRAARLFRLLGLLPGQDISVPAAASLSALPADVARSALEEIVRTHLLEQHRPGRYTFHDLLRDYAAEQAQELDSPADRRQAVHRMLDFYLHSALAAAHRFNPSKFAIKHGPALPGVTSTNVADAEEALSWLNAEFTVLLAAIEFAAANGFDQYAWQLPSTLTSYCWRRGRWQEGLRIQEIALEAARRLGEPRALAFGHYLLGQAQIQLSDFGGAEPNLREALARFRDMGDREGEAMALGGLGTMFDSQDRPAEALEEFLAALRIVKALGHWWTQGTVENCIGWQYAMLGHYEKAMNHCQRALGLLRESGNIGAMADTLDSLGLIYHKLGDLSTAKGYYAKAIELSQELGVPFGEARSLSALGDVLADEGDIAGARAAWFKAVTTLEALHHPYANEVRVRLASQHGLAQHSS